MRRIESSVEPLLHPDAVAKACANLSQYQGPAVLIPTLQHDQVVLLTSTPSPHESETFELGFIGDISSDCVQKMDLPQPHQFKEPCSEDQMDRLGKKQFSSETYKKICWVLQMYHLWRLQCNCWPDLLTVFADFDNCSTLSKSSVCCGISHFVTEIHKINSEEFPPKTLYEIVVCFQMHLESLGLFWKLLIMIDHL